MVELGFWQNQFLLLKTRFEGNFEPSRCQLAYFQTRTKTKTCIFMIKNCFFYNDGTSLTKPQKKIYKSKFGTSCKSAGPVLRDCVQLVLLLKQLLRSCTPNEKRILYPSLPNNQSICGLCYSGQEKSSVTRVGGLVIIHDFFYILYPHVHISLNSNIQYIFRLFQHILEFEVTSDLLARACGVPAVGVWAVDCWQWCSGHYFHPYFLFFFPRFFFSVATFSHRRRARIKKLI